MTTVSIFETWATIITVAITAVAGDILTAGAMRRIGDLDEIRAHSGLAGAIKAVVGSPMFLLGVGSMALSFFSLLFTLSVVDVSLAAPASAAITSSATPSPPSSSSKRTSTAAAGSPPSSSASASSSSRSKRSQPAPTAADVMSPHPRNVIFDRSSGQAGLRCEVEALYFAGPARPGAHPQHKLPWQGGYRLRQQTAVFQVRPLTHPLELNLNPSAPPTLFLNLTGRWQPLTRAR